MHRTRFLLTLGLINFAIACSDAGSDSTQHVLAATEHPADALAPAENGESVMFEADAVTIEPGTEAMYCHYLAPLEHDLVVRGFSTRQGRGGHHMVVYRALAQKPVGTVEECSSGESMTNLMLALTQTGTQEPGASSIEFPENHVLVLRAGTQLVAQSHYINTTEQPLVTHDKMTIYTTDADLATLTQLHLFVVTSVDFEIPPDGQAYSVTAGCALPQEVRFLSLAPHMHEWGTRIQLSIGDARPLSPILDVDGWTAEMRDVPPITSFAGADAPSDGRYAAGEIIELTCTWRNHEAHPLKFPNEMCATVGYFTTASDTTDVMCIGARK